jgi:hypothetical protein
MKKQTNSPNEKLEKREKLIKSLNERVERWKRMEQGDADALWECMYDRGMCSKEDLNEYYKGKARHGN